MSKRNSLTAKRARRAARQVPPVVRELRALAARSRQCGKPGSIPFANYVERVLRTGRSYPNGWSTPTLGTPDMCFGNAQALARERGWRYVEGLATEPAVPGQYAEGWIEHAWCLDDQGRVVECTWEHWPPRRYFGAVTALPPPELARWNPAYLAG